MEDGALIYFVAGTGVMALPKTGGAAYPVSAGSLDSVALAVAGGWVFWSDTGKNIWRAPTGGGAPLLVAKGIASPELAATATSVFAVEMTIYRTYALQEISVGGGAMRQIAATQDAMGTLRTHQSRVYWIKGGALFTWVGGESVELAPDARQYTFVGDRLFLTTSKGAIQSLAVRGGPSTIAPAFGPHDHVYGPFAVVGGRAYRTDLNFRLFRSALGDGDDELVADDEHFLIAASDGSSVFLRSNAGLWRYDP